jgi:RNA polymerase sigma-70 factor (ECF subfamily)
MTHQEFGYAVNSSLDDLKYHALRFTRDPNDADDLMQETKLKAISNREKFRMGTNLKAWLFTIMRNSFISKYQKKMRRNTFIDTTDNMHFINDDKYTTYNHAERKFVMDDVKNALNKLDDKFKQPFLLHYKGFKYYEIAEKFEVPIGTIKNRIHVARQLIKKQLVAY